MIPDWQPSECEKVIDKASRSLLWPVINVREVSLNKVAKRFLKLNTLYSLFYDCGCEISNKHNNVSERLSVL